MVVDTLVGTFGPFLIPAAMFGVGVIGYGILIMLTRYGVLPIRGKRDGGNN